MRKRFMRTKYLTGSRIQLHYLGLLLLSMVSPLVIVGGLLYYLMFNIMAEQIGVPEYIAINLFPVINKINTILMIGVPPVLFALILWGIALSHRFAGPVERLVREIGGIASHHDYKKRLKLRRSDDLLPVAEAVNILLDGMEKEKR